MTNFFTSDFHLGHARILELGSGRPFATLEEMHSAILTSWRETVKPEDTVFLLGDIIMGNFEETIKLFEGLNGNKMFVAGNHDRIFSGANSKSRIERHMPFFIEAGFTVLPENTSTFINTRWGKQEVLLSHFPFSGDSHSEEDRFANHRFTDNGLPLIHGHTHGNGTQNPSPREFHVGVDSHNFELVPESKIVEWLETIKSEGRI